MFSGQLLKEEEREQTSEVLDLLFYDIITMCKLVVSTPDVVRDGCFMILEKSQPPK